LLNGVAALFLVLLSVFITANLFKIIYSSIKPITFGFSANTFQQETDYGINVNGLSPHTVYAVTYDQGMCGGRPLRFISIGRPASAEFMTDENGNLTLGFSSSKVAVGQGLFQPLFVDIHQGDSTAGDTIACVQLQVNT
jgi:hypothetical protein